MESKNCSLIAAAIIANFTAGASGTYLGGSRSADTYRTTALKADDGVPHNLVTTAEGDKRPPEHREPTAKHLAAAPGQDDGPVQGPCRIASL